MNIEIEKAKREVARLEELLPKAKSKLWRLIQAAKIKKSGRPIYNFRNFRERPLDITKAHETEMVWWDTGTFNDNSLSNMFIWVCKFCKTPIRRKYINVGNHRDYDYIVCDCKGAARQGKPYKDLH